MLTESIALLLQIYGLFVLIFAFIIFFRFIRRREKDRVIERTIQCCSELRSQAWKALASPSVSSKKITSIENPFLLIETIRKYDAAAALVIRGYYEKEIFRTELEYEVITLLHEFSNTKIG
ncbi:hypothetical protein EHQ27_15910, partial [Leptospira wolffii]